MCPKGTFTLGFLWVGGAALLDALTSRIVISESRFPEGNVTQKLSVPGRSSDHPSLGGSARRALPPKDFSGLGRSPASVLSLRDPGDCRPLLSPLRGSLLSEKG